MNENSAYNFKEKERKNNFFFKFYFNCFKMLSKLFNALGTCVRHIGILECILQSKINFLCDKIFRIKKIK